MKPLKYPLKSKRSHKALYVVVISILILSGIIYGYSSGPPDASTGAPGENTCFRSGCHGNLNTGNGQVVIEAPGEYIPGDTLDVHVEVSQTGQSRWGFELTVLNSSNQPIGTILITDPTRTQISSSFGGRQYIKHTTVGTNAGVTDVSPGWNFKWIAPDVSSGPVTFYAAGNGANNNGFQTGDFIYTTSKTITEAVGTEIIDFAANQIPEDFILNQNYPNPFNPSTTIEYHLPNRSHVRLSVINVLGQEIITLVDREQSSGSYQVEWHGVDNADRTMPSGIYFYRLTTGNNQLTKKMVLLK